jgi:adenosine deaminase CECR1
MGRANDNSGSNKSVASLLRRRSVVLPCLAAVLLTAGATGVLVSRPQAQAPSSGPKTRVLGLALNQVAYDRERTNILRSLHERRFCSDIQLSPNERDADQILASHRNARVLRVRTSGNSSTFKAAQPFAFAKPAIDQSFVFKLMRQMPKGGLLHVHWPSCGRAEWLMTNVLRHTNCYVYWPTNVSDAGRGTLALLTAEQFRTNRTYAQYYPANDLRSRLPGDVFDQQMLELLTLGTNSVHPINPWNSFGQCFVRSMNAWGYQPLFVPYLLDTFQGYLADGIQHVEMRIVLQTLYDLEGRTWSETNMLSEFARARDIIRKTAPEFTLKIILTDLRWLGSTNTPQLLANTLKYNAMFPDLVIGCDLVGDEDNGRPTIEDVPVLLPFIRTNGVCHLFLHDGESSWANDHNIIDAALLRSKRIGHGFNLFRFPHLEDFVITNNIALEICPISNQSLGLLRDLRIHPAGGYLNRGVQCVLGSDDPFMFGNYGLSYDFWEAFQAWNLDLAALKKLAKNSLDFASFTPEEHQRALEHWNRRWTNWIQWVQQQPAPLLPASQPLNN